jgi:hypothetical protein
MAATMMMAVFLSMGRTIPSFSIVLEIEKEGWKPFRNALDAEKEVLTKCCLTIHMLFTSLSVLSHMLYNI